MFRIVDLLVGAASIAMLVVTATVAARCSEGLPIAYFLRCLGGYLVVGIFFGVSLSSAVAAAGFRPVVPPAMETKASLTRVLIGRRLVYCVSFGLGTLILWLITSS